MYYLILLTLLLTPAYIIRFHLLSFPTDVLMVWVVLVWVVFVAWLFITKRFGDYINYKFSIDKKVAAVSLLFLIAGVIALFVKGFDRQKLGQFIVLFLQPISLFFIGGYIFRTYPQSKPFLISTLYFLLAAAGLYGIIQYFTLIGLPSAWWGNSVEPKRALSFFVHPNFYALWCAPLLAFLIPDAVSNFKLKILNFKFILWLIGAVGLLLSLSRSGWLGLAAAIIFYLIFAADQKIRKIILTGILAVLIIVVAIPNLRWRLILPFYGEKSAVSRVSLWRDGWHAVQDAPITGLGLTGFATHYGALNTDPNLDTHNFPHNIFLDFWTETGLLGLISFLWLASIYIYRGLRALPPSFEGGARGGYNIDQTIKLGIALFLIALIFQGLVDNPYFKNDLAMVFWIILSLTL